MQLEIINLYYFSLQQTDESYLQNINLLLQHIRAYLQEEWITLKTAGSDVGHYDVIEFHLENIGKLLFFQKEKNLPKELTYFPEMYCEIHVESPYLEENEKLRKLIFLLSNIFECFDIFEEKYIFIEYHSRVEKLKANQSFYKLRHQFHDINELGKNYDFANIQKHLLHFQESRFSVKNIEKMKLDFPETYTSLLLFCYLIFSLQRNKASLETELQHLKNTDFSLREWQANQELFILRAQEKQRQIDTTLKIYTDTFEQFLKIFL